MGIHVEILPYLDDLVLIVTLSPPEFAPGRITISIDIRDIPFDPVRFSRRPL